MKLRHLDTWNGRRKALVDHYRAELADCADLVLPTAPTERSSWHLFVGRHPRRDALAAHLRAAGIQVQIHYPIPPHASKAYAADELGVWPIAEQLSAEILSLPIGPHLSIKEADRVCAAVRAFCG